MTRFRYKQEYRNISCVEVHFVRTMLELLLFLDSMKFDLNLVIFIMQREKEKYICVFRLF